jgi:hypothetical protein
LVIIGLAWKCYYLYPSAAAVFDAAYRLEKDVVIREGLLLVRRVLVDNEKAARVAEDWSRWYVGIYK